MYLDTSHYAFTKDLEANWNTVRHELLTLADTTFMAFPEKHLYDTGWNVFGLYFFGRKWKPNTSLCPETTKLVESIPGMVTAGFSRLEPGTHIKPHVGYTNAVLRCHLGLIVPDGCCMRVGDEIRTWHEGKTLVFDDTTEHEVWNRSDKVRIILLIDFKRPGTELNVDQLMQELQAKGKLYG
jgi:ornithine lipid ester-linked acyl 2-hydroxylase